MLMFFHWAGESLEFADSCVVQLMLGLVLL